MRAALYLRRSTDEHQAESLSVQEEQGRRFIQGRGWTLEPTHVFVEDGVSRSEFKKRPALIALLNAVDRSEIDVVVARDETRIGGDMLRTGILMQDLIDGGVRLFYYYTGEEVRLDSAVDKFVVSAKNFASELEREKISQRTHEHLLTKARRGLNVGGRCYGYDNVRTDDGTVEYRIDEQQAQVVRGIYERYAAGDGLRAIVKDLNDRGVPAPTAGKRGTRSWSHSCISSMLQRERYRGVVVWNKTEKRYRGGTKVRVRRPECEWIRVEAPELRVIDEALWHAVLDRRERTRRTAGKKGRRGPRPKYLLSSLARCGECGGPLKVSSGKVGSVAIKVYGCAYHRDRGNAVCGNRLRRPVDSVDQAVVDWIQENVLTEEVIAATLREVRRRLAERAESQETEVPRLRTEAEELRHEIDRLSEAIATSSEKPKALVTKIDERERRLRAIRARIEALESTPGVVDLEIRRMEQEARKRMRDLKSLLDRNPTEARRALEALLDDKLTFTPIETPEGRRYQIEGPLRVQGALFTTDGVPRGV